MARSIQHNAHEQLIHPISFSHFTRFSSIVREWILEFDRPEQRVMDQGGLAGNRVCVSAEGQAALPEVRPFLRCTRRGWVPVASQRFRMSRNVGERNARYDRDVDGAQRSGLSPQVVRRDLRPVVPRHWRVLQYGLRPRRLGALERRLRWLLRGRSGGLRQQPIPLPRLPAERLVLLLRRLGRKLEAGLRPLWRAPSWLWL